MRKVLIMVILAVLSLSAEVLVSDDFESDTGNWTLAGNWGLEEGSSVSGTHFLTESPTGNYTANEVSSATWATPIDLSTSEFATVVFWTKYALEDGFDYMHFEISYDNGSSWERLKSWTGNSSTEWSQETVFPISAYNGPAVFRFLFRSDQSVELGGMNIDDIYLYSQPESHDTFGYHVGPVFYEVPYGVYESYVEVYDTDGIDSVFVEYSVDFNDSLTQVNAVYAGSNIWEFSIPMLEAGHFVEYFFRAVEASEEHLTVDSRKYIYISGEHNVYDTGIVSHYLPIEINESIAVKFDKGWGSWYITGALIRNYADLDHISADMQIHIFDDNSGVPGNELTMPIDVSPVATSENQTPFTWVDLWEMGLSIPGDYYWIVLTAPYGTVYTTIEEVGDPEEVTPYYRSYSGVWTGSEWSWIDQPLLNYHIRTVCGYKESIEDTSVPSASVLHQNYPNPFNPSTEISYSLKSEGMVTLSVFNTKGELVSTLVNGKKTAGNHSINFNGEGLNSGIYFYKLDINGSTVGSKRMLLIK